jgi:ABC-type branched-subunit amino acid transport system ATPase component
VRSRGESGSADPDAPVLEIRGAVVRFGGIAAVEDLSLALQAGQIYGLLGPNGSGKSTLLAAITRLVSMAGGDLRFAGTSYASVSAEKVARMGISRTFQTVRLLADLTVRQNVQLGADLRRRAFRGWPHRSAEGALAEAHVDSVIERVGLSGLERVRPGELSYGFQRRVEIARALCMNPRLLLLDEPTAGMNRSERTEIVQLLSSLRAESQLTQLVVEHDVQMMIDSCDYLFAMNFGRLIAQGEPDRVVRDPAVQEAYLGKRGAAGA